MGTFWDGTAPAVVGFCLVRRCVNSKEGRNNCGTGSKSGGGNGFQASDAVTLSDPEATEEDEGSMGGKGASVKAMELRNHSQTEEPPAQGVPRQLAQLPQLRAPALGACAPGAPLSRVTSLSERISSPISTQLKKDI